MPETQIAFTACLVFIAVAFGWRSWLQYRRTGDAGFRAPSGRSGVAEWFSWALMLLGGLATMLTPVVASTETIRRFVYLPAQICGLVLIALGMVLTVIAQVQLGESWRIGVHSGEATPLVTDGVYRHVRNPIFTGMLIALLGLVLLLPHILSVLGFALVATGFEVQVRRVEEPYLLSVHGERYRDYAGSAGRFFPGVGNLF